MNAFRKISLVILVALFALSILSSSADAGGCHSGGYGGGSYTKFCDYGSYGNYASCYGGNCYWPTTYPTYSCVKPISYPVTYYDCYGRPYIVWQTGYNTNPLW